MKLFLSSVFFLFLSSSSFASDFTCFASLGSELKNLESTSADRMTATIGKYQFAVTQISTKTIAFSVLDLQKKEKIAFLSGFAIPTSDNDASSLLFLPTGESVMLACRTL